MPPGTAKGAAGTLLRRGLPGARLREDTALRPRARPALLQGDLALLPRPAACFFPGKWGRDVSAPPGKPEELQGRPGQAACPHCSQRPGP